MTAETFVADSLVLSEYTLNYYKKPFKHHAMIAEKGQFLLISQPGKCVGEANVSEYARAPWCGLLTTVKSRAQRCNTKAYLATKNLRLG